MPKRQKVNATLDLILRDTDIARDEKILQKLKLAVRNGMRRGRALGSASVHPALYRRFRGHGFPVSNLNNRRLPAWRSLTPWMKAQLIAMCIGQHEHRQFRIRLHDDVRLREETKGTDLKKYLRDRLTRLLGQGFDEDPWYLFVIEDLDADGRTFVRPHAHGIIRIRPFPIQRIKDVRSRAAYKRSAKSAGIETAELRAGIAMTRRLLKQATGNGPGASRKANGISQEGNLWLRQSYHLLFNDEAISYAFKNSDSPMSQLPKERLAISRGARSEAQKFWELIRLGEKAIHLWS